MDFLRIFLLTNLAVGFTVALVGADAEIARTGCLAVDMVGCFAGEVRFGGS